MVNFPKLDYSEKDLPFFKCNALTYNLYIYMLYIQYNVVHIYHIPCGSIIILKHHKGHTVAVWAMGSVSFLKHPIITLANLILVA